MTRVNYETLAKFIEMDEFEIQQSKRHPNKNEHEWIAEALYRKIIELEKLKDYLLL